MMPSWSRAMSHVWVVPAGRPGREASSRTGAARRAAGARRLPRDHARDGRDHAKDRQAGTVLAGGQGHELCSSTCQHSERLALLAVTGTLPVGVEVQAPPSDASKPWFAKRICTAREYEHFLLTRASTYDGCAGPQGGGDQGDGASGHTSPSGDIDVLDAEVEGGWLCSDLDLGDAADYHAAVAVFREPGVAVTTRRSTGVRRRSRRTRPARCSPEAVGRESSGGGSASAHWSRAAARRHRPAGASASRRLSGAGGQLTSSERRRNRARP